MSSRSCPIFRTYPVPDTPIGAMPPITNATIKLSITSLLNGRSLSYLSRCLATTLSHSCCPASVAPSKADEVARSIKAAFHALAEIDLIRVAPIFVCRSCPTVSVTAAGTAYFNDEMCLSYSDIMLPRGDDSMS